MEGGGFVSRRTSPDTPCVDNRVAGAAATGTGVRWFGGRLLSTTGGFVGGLPSRVSEEQDLSPVLSRATAQCSTEADVDYEGLPQGATTGTHMLAGTVAGIMEHCLMYPVDCVKVLCHTAAQFPQPAHYYGQVSLDFTEMRVA